jgi:RecB family exonuclease
MKHIDDIINGLGEFEIFTTERGVQFWEKLSDGRGLRLNLDGTFKGFIDQIR